MVDNQKEDAAQWYECASRDYVEKHQGCAWCGTSYCVFRSPRSDRVEYSCSACEFFTCHDHQTNRYYTSPGAPTQRFPGSSCSPP